VENCLRLWSQPFFFLFFCRVTSTIASVVNLVRPTIVASLSHRASTFVYKTTGGCSASRGFVCDSCDTCSLCIVRIQLFRLRCCAGYLRCLATVLPNGARVLVELFRDEIPSSRTTTCLYPLFYHPMVGFSYCALACARNEAFCLRNCPGNTRY